MGGPLQDFPVSSSVTNSQSPMLNSMNNWPVSHFHGVPGPVWPSSMMYQAQCGPVLWCTRPNVAQFHDVPGPVWPSSMMYQAQCGPVSWCTRPSVSKADGYNCMMYFFDWDTPEAFTLIIKCCLPYLQTFDPATMQYCVDWRNAQWFVNRQNVQWFFIWWNAQWFESESSMLMKVTCLT